MLLGTGTAWAGPCDMGRTANKDAGSGPSQSSSQTTGISTDAKQHPPTQTMNRASGDVAASSQDTQRQMQGQPTASQQAEGAKPGSPTNSHRPSDRCMPSRRLPSSPGAKGRPLTRAVEQRKRLIASRHTRTISRQSSNEWNGKNPKIQPVRRFIEPWHSRRWGF
jgi:hypothetical protein